MSNKLSVDEYRRQFHIVQTKKPLKYRNQPQKHEGIRHDGQKEKNRYYELLIRLQANEIHTLERQKRFEIVPKNKDERAVYYYADFVYFDCLLNSWIIEDVKGPYTRKIGGYVIKRKLTKLHYPDYIFIET